MSRLRAERGGANALGRSRGGFTCKIHARCDNQGLPLGFILTGGEASDYTAAEPLMEIPVTTPKGLLADKGYDGGRFRESLLIRGILPIIPPRSNRKVPEHPDYRRYRDRNRVERMFGKLKQQRVSQPATTRPSYPSSSISPPLACG
jgi:transposase